MNSSLPVRGFSLLRLFQASLAPLRLATLVVLYSAVAASAAQLTVSWTDNSWDEDSFKIERADGAGSFVEIASVGPDVVSYVDSTVVFGTVYSYRVRAHNFAGYSAYTNVVTNAVAITTQPAATVNVAAHGNTSISVTATGVPAPTYQWQRNGLNVVNDSRVTGATTNTLTFTDVMPSYSGDYTVVISNGAGSPTTSSVSTLTVPKIAPVITWATPSSIDDDVPLSATQLNASADVAGTFVYNPAVGALLGVGTHTLTADFTPTDTANYSNASKTVSLQVINIVPTRPSTFDANGYLLSNPDVAGVIGNVPDKFDKAWNHYYEYGVFEGRTDGDFDVHKYLADYPSLAVIYGTDLQGAAMHWYTIGRQTGLRVPNGFDVDGYLARNLDIAALFSNDKYGAWLHYYNYGVWEGRTFDANFIAAEYLELNTDVKAVFGGNLQQATMHWLTWGHPVEDRMGRVPIGFNVPNYLARYPDLTAVFGGITPTAVRNVVVWHHYLAYGTLEGRSDGDFEAFNYLATNPDLNAIFAGDVQAAALHWYFYGRREGRRIPGGFNVQNYRSLYPDIVLVFGDDLYGSWLHYRDTGVNEGRIYDNLFRVDEYLDLNPDIDAAVGGSRTGALMHWLYYGQYEGRQGRY